MFDKFTEPSRRVLVLAKEEAGVLNHSLIGSEHILLGLLREGVGIGSKTLESLGITHDIALAKVVEMVGEGQQPPLEYIPFAPSTRRVLEFSLDEAGRLGHRYIGTESILLALTAERDGTAARVLVQLGADPGQVRSRVIDLLTGIYPASGAPAVHRSVAADTGAGFFERFTNRAKRVVVLAKDEAKTLNHNYIGTEHILLGLIREGQGVGIRALEELRISPEAARRQIEEIIGQGQQAPSGHLPFTVRAKEVLKLAGQEAKELGHSYVGTEHILLGLIREGQGVAARVLIYLGADMDQTRQRVIQLLTGYQPRHLPSSEHVTAKLEQNHAIPVGSAPSMAVADIVDREANQLLEDAVQEAQEAGDLALGGQHVLLAMCLHDNSGWLALRWAGVAPRPLMTAGLRATSNGSPHKQSVPLSPELRKALDDGRHAAGRPLSAAALLASLIRNQEPGCMQTIAGVGLIPQDVLDAITALARIGEIDAAAGRLATIARAAELTQSPRPAVSGHVHQTQDHRQEQSHSKALAGSRGWDAPDREAAMSMFQFRLAAVSGIYLLLIISALVALVATATNGRLWLLALAPLLGLGYPRLGTWSLVPVAALFWWLHLSVIAALVTVLIPIDALMGALMLQRSHISEHPPENRRDLRIGVRQIVRAVGLGAGTQK